MKHRYAVDFESYYDKDISIVTMGTELYLKNTDVYLVSVVGSDGTRWVGHPKDAPWEKMNGHIWVSHNRSFDELVYNHLLNERILNSDHYPDAWHCTSDLVSFLGVPRSLSEACKFLLKVEVSKTTRDDMRGKRWEDMTDEFKEEVMEYALIDSDRCLELWEKYGHLWPESEREASRQTSLMGWRGVPLDIKQLEEGLSTLDRVMWEAQNKLPWANDPKAKILSPKALGVACREVGIEPPSSLSQDSEECAAWEIRYGEKYPWVGAMRDYRRANILKEKLLTMKTRYREEDGRMGYSLKYFGAALTGRWSGDGGFNCLTGDHEVLTPEGWVPLEDWDDSTSPILQWEADGTLTFVRAEKLSAQYDGKLIGVNNPRVRLLGTPNHRVVSFNSRGMISERPASRLLESRVSKIPTHGVFDAEYMWLSDDELRVLVALAADGSVGKKGAVSFGLKKSRKIRRLRELLANANIPYEEVVRTNGATYFYIKKSERPSWLNKGFGEWVLSLSHAQASIVLDELRHWDGASHPRSEALIFYSADKSQAEWVTTLAHIHGKTVSLNQYDGGWVVYFKQEGSNSHITPSREVTEVPFKGKVYCPSVPSGMFLVRYKDRIHVTGNSQNIHRDAMWGIDVRGLIAAPKDKKFIIADLSQIEPRCLAWLNGDDDFLEACAKGISPYEVHARNSMGFSGDIPLKDADKKGYALAKARVLGLGYGAGWEKFIALAALYGALECFEDPVTPEQSQAFVGYLVWLSEMKGPGRAKNLALLTQFNEMPEEEKRVWVNSWLQVTDFRKTNPRVTELWKRLETDARKAIGKDYRIELPSGRSMIYRGVSGAGGLSAQVSKNGRWVRNKLYGGLLTENLCQGTARDVFTHLQLKLTKAGFPIPIMTIHDEFVFEVDKSVEPEEILSIMRKAPDWMEGLPLDAEAVETDRYTK